MAAQSNALNEGIDLASDGLARTGGKLSEARNRIQDLYARTKERAGDMQDQVGTYVSEQPIRSILIAAGVGACIGLLVGALASRR